MSDNSLRRHDIDRIYQDVVNERRLDVLLLRIDQTATGWCISAKDRGDRVVSVHVPGGPAALVRATLASWTADQGQLDSLVEPRARQ